MEDNKYSKTEKIDHILKEKIDYSKLDKEFIQIIELIDNFRTTLKSINPNYDFYNLDNNLQDLIVTVYYNYQKDHFRAAYDFISNEININSKCIQSDLYHELFHLASSKRNETGFMICDKKDCHNFGLNEGYTDLLAQRYFNEESFYNNEKNIAYLLEKIVTNKKMEELYYNADTDGLISELENYTSKNDIFAFMTNLDYISSFNRSEQEILYPIFYDVYSFLIKAYYNKETNLFIKNLIDEKNFIYDLSSYVTLMRQYNLLNNLDIRTIINEVISKENIPLYNSVKRNNTAKIKGKR